MSTHLRHLPLAHYTLYTDLDLRRDSASPIALAAADILNGISPASSHSLTSLIDEVNAAFRHLLHDPASRLAAHLRSEYRTGSRCQPLAWGSIPLTYIGSYLSQSIVQNPVHGVHLSSKASSSVLESIPNQVNRPSFPLEHSYMSTGSASLTSPSFPLDIHVVSHPWTKRVLGGRVVTECVIGTIRFPTRDTDHGSGIRDKGTFIPLVLVLRNATFSLGFE